MFASLVAMMIAQRGQLKEWISPLRKSVQILLAILAGLFAAMVLIWSFGFEVMILSSEL